MSDHIECEDDRECEECGCKLMMNGDCAFCDDNPLAGNEIGLDPGLSEKYPMAGPPQWIEEKRMDLFNRVMASQHDLGLDPVPSAKYAVNEFDKFFETGLAKEEGVPEPEVSEVKYKAVVEDEGSEQHGIYTYMGFICVTDKEGKQTIVKDMPVLGEGIDEVIAFKNFHLHAKEIIEQLKIEGRFE